MVYTKTVWVASTAPGISATNLNNLETQYDCAVVIGEVKLYTGSTAPVNFFLCNGTSKQSAVYPALFAVTSHYYGGDATWFHLPNMMGQFPVGYSSNVGDYDDIGNTGGSSDVTLTLAQIPEHTHTIPAESDLSGGSAGWAAAYGALPSTDAGLSGGNAPHENRPPYVVLNYIVRYQ
jgi:microcystin-dependent protein